MFKRFEKLGVGDVNEFDQLTGVLNKQEFYRQCEQLLQDSKVVYAAIFLINLDRFKFVNDSFGYEAGDKVLQTIAHRIQVAFTSDALVGRNKGDEFIIFCYAENIQHTYVEVVRKLIYNIEKAVEISEKKFYPSVCCGISLYPNHTSELIELIKFADITLADAKNRKKKYRLFDKKLEAEFTESLIIKQDLRDAVKKGELTIHYQPIVDRGQELFAIEALVRWKHPRLGFIQPQKFVATAEENGFIIELGKWIIEKAFKDFNELQPYLPNNIYLSINISLAQFSDADFIYILKEAVEKNLLNTKQIILEITESIPMDEVELISSVLRNLKRSGFKIALDDFGTGYSSLSQMTSLPLSMLKLDKSFINGIEKPKQNMLVSSIINIAHHLNLAVVAEGVEQSNQMRILNEMNCDFQQGFLHSKPLPLESVIEKIAKM